jgi:hypothetical protein
VNTTTPWLSPVGLLFIIAAALILSAVLGSSASAMPVRYERQATLWGFYGVQCGKQTSFTFGFPGARKPRVTSGPEVGQTMVTDQGDPVAVVVIVERARDELGDIGIRWTVEGSSVACERPDERFDTKWVRFGMTWRIPRSQYLECGKVRFLNFTRASVEANGYVSSCRKARSIASAWSRYQMADNGIHPMRKFSTPTTIRGYRCSGAHPVEQYSVGVNCRRGRAKVSWQWGD